MYVNYLVCYDVSDSTRRKKFSDSLKELGLVPLQKSVFYGGLNLPEARSLEVLARKVLLDEEDRCLWFPCHLDINKVRACLGYRDFQYVEADGYLFL